MEPDERQPLFARPPEDLDDDDTQHELPQDSFATADRVTVVVLLCLTLFTMDISNTSSATAMFNIQLEILCRQHGGNETCGLIPGMPIEYMAEIDNIQRVRGILAVISGILTAMPYGLAADKYSRRNLLALCVGGVLISTAAESIVCMFPKVFPLRLIWLTAVLKLIGGGPQVFYALVFAIATDVSTQAERSLLFLLLGSVTTLTSILGFCLSRFFADKDPWVAIYLSLATVCISTVLVLFIPATRDATSLRRYEITLGPDDSESRTSKLGKRVKKASREIHSTVRAALWGDRRLSAIFLGIFLLGMSPYSLVMTFMVYSLADWFDIEKMDNLIYISMGSSLVLTAVILPPIAYVLQKQYHFAPFKRDLWLMRVLPVILVVGALLTCFAKSAGVVIAGTVLMAPVWGFLLLSRSLISLVSGEQHLAILFCLVGGVWAVAFLIGRPILDLLWSLGMNSDAILRGFPFLVLAILYAVTTVLTLSIRDGDEADESDETV